MKKLFAAILVTFFFSILFTVPALATTSNLYLTSDPSTVFGQINEVGGWLWPGSTDYIGTNGLNGKTINLKYHYYGKDWRQWSLVTNDFEIEGTTIKGIYFKDWRPSQNVWYQAEFLGADGYEAVTSDPIKSIVRVKITLSGVKRSKYIEVSGTVYPTKAGRYIYIKIKRKGGSWITIKKKLDSRSRYSYRYYFPRKGTYYAKVAYPGDRYNGSNSSATKTFIVN